MNEKTAMRTEDVINLCTLTLGQTIRWAYTTIDGIQKSKSSGDESWFTGKVVADYEYYIILESPKGYRYCINKQDIATKQIAIKGFEPHVPRVPVYLCREGNLKEL